MERPTYACLSLMAVAAGMVPASAAAARTKVGAARHVETYEARLLGPEGSPYVTADSGQRAIVQLARGARAPGTWTLGVRIYHDYINRDVYDDLILDGHHHSGPFVGRHTLRRGLYSLYYGLPERLRLTTGKLAVPLGGKDLAIALELTGKRSGSRGALGTVTLERALEPAEGDRLVFDPFANQVLRPAGLARWIGPISRWLGSGPRGAP